MDAGVPLTGATGYIGGRLLRQFEEGGRAVRCLVRQPARLGAAGPATEVVQGSRAETGEVRPAGRGRRLRVGARANVGQSPGVVLRWLKHPLR